MKEENIFEIQDVVKIVQESHDIILEKGDRIKILREETFFDTRLGMVVKNSVSESGFSPVEDLIRPDYVSVGYWGRNKRSNYAICIPSYQRTSVYEVFKNIYLNLKSNNFLVSKLKDTRPEFDSMEFSIKFRNHNILFRVAGLGTSFTPILIDWQ